jgi:hypothetical protein
VAAKDFVFFRFGRNGGAPLQNLKTLASPVTIQCARDVSA